MSTDLGWVLLHPHMTASGSAVGMQLPRGSPSRGAPFIASMGADAKNCGGDVVSIELPKNADDYFHYGLGRGMGVAASSPCWSLPALVVLP